MDSDSLEVSEEQSEQAEAYLHVDLPPPKKKAGRKKVAQRRKVNRSKERGKYKGSSRDSVCNGDEDLAECLFSDDELREEYLAAYDQCSDSQMSLELSESGTSVDNISNRSSESLQSSLQSSFFGDSDSSRPSSSLSRPASAADLSAPNVGVQREEIEDSASATMEKNISPTEGPSITLIESGLEKFRAKLIKPWLPIADKDGFHLLLLSKQSPKAIQREIFISYNGNVNISMHCKTLPDFSNIFKSELQSRVTFSEDSIDQYCLFGLSLVMRFMQYVACIGANDLDSKLVWEKVQGGAVDCNPYREEKFTETYRSLSCARIVILGKKKRCNDCQKLFKNIMMRKDFLLSTTAAPSTKNQYLTLTQAISKLESQHEELRRKEKKIAYLECRVQLILESEGVNIEEDLNESFSRILLASDKLTEPQKMFLQEQWSAAHKSDSRVHRWHPSMIRLALHLHMSSSGTYDDFRDTGCVLLPHSRTLFDYSHCIQAKDGINEGLVKLVADRVQQLNEPHKEFHVLMFDGIHVSQNLVFRASDGVLVGFTKIDEVEKEMEVLDKFVKGEDPISSDPPLATEVLAYLVKGMASDVKCVIASYPIKALSKEMLYKRTWDVIRHLENGGVKVLALVCDGHPTNRAFFKMHTPHTTGTMFGAIFDTVNFCAPDRRLIFFISDLCHLLKTIRNAFYNSGEGPKKPRLLKVKGMIIVWKTIVRLFFTFKNHNFRKSYKLNAQNVFPNSYSRMKVRFAGEVLSNTVAQDLEDQDWPETEETIRFIRWVDRFFDCLNGAHTSVAKKKRKPDLAPYTIENIEFELKEGRFKFLHSFLDYLMDWKKEVDRLPLLDEKKERMMLPKQTLLGIETTIEGIEAATVFFLDAQKCGGKFVNARIFSQDPIEQHFSKQRCRGGGSRNPNVAQFQQGQVVTALQRGLGCKKRKSNSTEGDVGMQVTNEPVPKRARHSTKGK